MDFDAIKALSLFCFIIFGAFALFYAFAPYEWICEYHSAVGGKQVCNISHIVVFFLALLFFVLALVSWKDFNFSNIFMGKGIDMVPHSLVVDVVCFGVLLALVIGLIVYTYK